MFTASICHYLGEKDESQNQILKDYEIKTIDYLIKYLLMHGILPTHQIILNSIVSLKQTHDLTNVVLSRQWF